MIDRLRALLRRLRLRAPWLVGLAAIALTGCVVGASPASKQMMANLTTVANAGTADLDGVIAVANAATPPAPHLAACATATLQVAAAMKQVLAATPTGSTVGVFTAAAVASLYQPGSAQYNYAVTTIETGCIAEVHDVMQSAQATAGMPAAIVAALGIAGLPAGL
jgi:hypothetical protein